MQHLSVSFPSPFSMMFHMKKWIKMDKNVSPSFLTEERYAASVSLPSCPPTIINASSRAYATIYMEKIVNTAPIRMKGRRRPIFQSKASLNTPTTG
jgi:hypothetical protein